MGERLRLSSLLGLLGCAMCYESQPRLASAETRPTSCASRDLPAIWVHEGGRGLRLALTPTRIFVTLERRSSTIETFVADRSGSVQWTRSQGNVNGFLFAAQDRTAAFVYSHNRAVVLDLLDAAQGTRRVTHIPGMASLPSAILPAKDGWLILGTAWEGGDMQLQRRSSSALRLSSTQVLGEFHTAPLREQFFGLLPDGDGWLAFHHGIWEGADAHPAAQSAILRLDDHLVPQKQRLLPAAALAGCTRVLPLGEPAALLCSSQVLRFDRAGNPMGSLPLPPQALSATVMTERLVLLRREERPSGPARLCVAFLGQPSWDCFSSASAKPPDAQESVPAELAADAGEVMVAWLAHTYGGDEIRLRAYRCEAARQPLPWQSVPLSVAPWQALPRPASLPAPAPLPYQALDASSAKILIDRGNPLANDFAVRDQRRIGALLSACSPSASPPRLAIHEVTVGEYLKCTAAHRCPPLPAFRNASGDYPMTNVSVEEAAAYCAFIGSRLPSDHEWTEAALTDCKPFPWGEDEEGRKLMSAGAFQGPSNCIRRESGYHLLPPGAMPYDVVRGIYDLHGNALEWTADKTVRGSRFCSALLGSSEKPPESGRNPFVGFRCMAPGEGPPHK